MKCSLTFTGCDGHVVKTERRRTGYTQYMTTYGFCQSCLEKLRRWNRKRLVEPRHYGTSLSRAIWPDVNDIMSDQRRLEDARRYRAKHPFRKHYAENSPVAV